MIISDRTKGAFSQADLAALTLPWTQEKFSRPYPFSGLAGMGDIDFSGTLDQTVQNTIDAGTTALNTAIANAIATRSGETADPVPVQNAVLYNVLAPVSNALAMPAVTSNATVLNKLLQFLNAGQQAWQTWTTANPSSRTTGAIQTLAPYFTRLQQAINTDLAKLGAAPSVIPGTNIILPGDYMTSGISAGMVAVAAIALYWFTKK